VPIIGLIPMAVVVIFCLGFATILTLVVVPSLYVMLTRLSRWLGIQEPELEPEVQVNA